ncbi:MAG: serine hydrolase [Eubacteriales bacterium]|nr:serine hydrolase [Eubacteriales bacterium]
MNNIHLTRGANPGAVCDFINSCYDSGTNLHSFQYVKGGRVVAKVALSPYSFIEKMLVYSLSKSFTSACVGVAQSEGILNIDERIVDIFPDKCPDIISENLSEMRIKDCLCMTSGHSACVFEHLQNQKDPVRYFLSQPLDYRPVTTFVYSTAATFICGAAVTKRSGMNLLDYLYEKVLKKMDLEKPEWRSCPDGSKFGGTGLVISGDSITEFGKMICNGGVYKGKKIIPEEWIKTASSIHSVTPKNGTADWTAGYGYQFWLNARGGFRGDGAYGQLCMIFPERDIVFTVLSESINMQKEVDCVYRLLDEIDKPDDGRIEELKTLVQTLYLPEKCKSDFKRVEYKPKKNIAGISAIVLDPCDDGIVVSLECDYKTQKIQCGNGFYKKNQLLLKNLTPGIWTKFIEEKPREINVYASYNDSSQNEITVTLRHIDAPHTQVWHFPKKEDGDWYITMHCGALNPQIVKTPVIINR